jgi:hypothetical protein
MHFTCFLYYLYPWLKMVTNQNNVALWTLIKLSLKETHTHTHTHTHTNIWYWLIKDNRMNYIKKQQKFVNLLFYQWNPDLDFRSSRMAHKGTVYTSARADSRSGFAIVFYTLLYHPYNMYVIILVSSHSLLYTFCTSVSCIKIIHANIYHSCAITFH